MKKNKSFFFLQEARGAYPDFLRKLTTWCGFSPEREKFDTVLVLMYGTDTTIIS